MRKTLIRHTVPIGPVFLHALTVILSNSVCETVLDVFELSDHSVLPDMTFLLWINLC